MDIILKAMEDKIQELRDRKVDQNEYNKLNVHFDKRILAIKKRQDFNDNEYQQFG